MTSNNTSKVSFACSSSTVAFAHDRACCSDSQTAPVAASKANDKSFEPTHKVSLVTGGNRGIGLGLVRGIAKYDPQGTVIFSGTMLALRCVVFC